VSRTRAFLRTALVVLASLSLTAGAFAGIGPAAAATTVYQAENATIFQGVVESNHAGYTGTGFVNYDNIVGSYVEWTVSAAQTGSARLTFRYANGGTTSRPMDITVNGVLVADELAFPPTGAWSSWQTSSTTATLNAGANTIRATATSASGGPNVDSLEVTDPTGPDVTLTVGSTSGALLRDDFMGLSFEADVIASPGLAAGNLAQYLKTLGPGVMRFGGNNVDKTFWTSSGEPTPSWAIARLTPTDLERLNTLAVASGWKVLLGVNLKQRDPARAANEASHAKRILGDRLMGIHIGNEPNYYPDYSQSQLWADFQAYRAAIQSAVPGLGVMGPETGRVTAAVGWLTDFATRQKAAGVNISALTTHYYPACATSSDVTISSLVSLAYRDGEATRAELLADLARDLGVPGLMDEANSVSCEGKDGVSDTFASALWAVDFEHLVAQTGVRGLYFHSSIARCGAPKPLYKAYTPFCAPTDADAAAGRLRAQPEYYGLLLQQKVGTGNFLPVQNSDTAKVRAYAVRRGDRLRLVLVNVQDPATSAPLTTTVRLPGTFTYGTTVSLTGPTLDATTGITLGGHTVHPDGTFAGTNSEPLPVSGNEVTVTLPPGTATLVTLTNPVAQARAIVGQLTLDEKIGQLHGIRTDTVYRYVPPVPRLGVPELLITNGPAGVSTGGVTQPLATALPAPISLAASWDVRMARAYGDIGGEETIMVGRDLLEGPTVNMARVPLNGRTFEAYGEDPYLAGQIATQWINGVQAHGVIGNVKHYIANNQETNRFTINEAIDERTMREIYLPAFETALSEGKVGSVMCAFPRINGTFNCENRLLLTDILKRGWGFDGFVFSDFGAVHSTVGSANAGLDLEMPTAKYFGDALKTAVQNGQVTMATIDDKLVRRYATMIKAGIFDRKPNPTPIPAGEHGAVARQLAQQGMVLLKNAPVGTGATLLPLNAGALRSIAVIGKNEAKTGGGGSSRVLPLYTVRPVDGIRARAGSTVTVTHVDGLDLAAAAAAARSADVAVVMVEDSQREGVDQPSLALSGTQDDLVRQVVAANPRTVVVVKTGGPVLMPWVGSVPAIVQAWYPGQEDGNAVARVLFGDFNPSGKLPITFPRSQSDLPTNTVEQYPGVNGTATYTEGIFIGYRHYDRNNIAPLFPFGHGLSYTTFSYANLKVTTGTAGQASVEADVTNSGTRLGGEIVQLYVGSPATAVPEAPKELQGFQKVTLAPGETRHVTFTLGPRAFSYWDSAADRWRVAGGQYRILVGSGSRDVRLNGTVQLAPSP
jgi:beta-glucosidase